MRVHGLVPRKSGRGAMPARRDVGSFEDLFEDFFRGFSLAPVWSEGEPGVGFVPSIDVRETDDELQVMAELPGLEEKDFEVILDGEMLTLKGEKKVEHEEKRKGYHHVESMSGSFRRRIALPCEVDANAVKAAFKNGVLTITLPKTPEAQKQARTIPITTS